MKFDTNQTFTSLSKSYTDPKKKHIFFFVIYIEEANWAFISQNQLTMADGYIQLE